MTGREREQELARQAKWAERQARFDAHNRHAGSGKAFKHIRWRRRRRVEAA